MTSSHSFFVLGLGLYVCACAGVGPQAGSSGASSEVVSAGPGQVERESPNRDPDPKRVVDQPKKACPCQSKVEGTAPDGGMAPDGGTAPAALPEGTKVLHVGDSFAGALGIPLGALLEKAGVKSVLKHTDASYLTDWAWNGELEKFIWKYNPDLLIITLGANELAIAEPSQRIKTIRKITSLIGDRPCLWVAIPLWQGRHNGLMDVIRENSAPCVYWDSNRLIDVEHMPRISDGIHPTTEARNAWAQVVFDWLEVHRKPEPSRPWVLAF